MMRCYVRCEVCGAITLIRVQVGWVNKFPIRVHCGKCGILISGDFLSNFSENDFYTKCNFKNAVEIQEAKPDYYIEASSEFFTSKLKSITTFEETLIQPPPFFKALWSMSDKDDEIETLKYNDFKKRTESFLYLIENDWHVLRRINELWLACNYSYLPNEVHEFLEKTKFPMNNELEYLRGVHKLNITFFSPIMDEERIQKTINILKSELQNMISTNENQLKKFIKYFEDKNLLSYYQRKIFKQFEKFTEIFNFILPVFALRFYSNTQIDYSNEGITTTSFEDIKQFYSDSYEIIIEMFNIIIGLNNIKYRGDFNTFNNSDKVNNLDELSKIPKARKKSLAKVNEVFSHFNSNNLNNKLRNAIGHNSYEYDGKNQILHYEDSKNNNQIFLIRFCQECLELFYLLCDFNELVCVLRTFNFKYNGHC